MYNRKTECKIEAIRSLIYVYVKKKYTGDIDFKLNFNQGGITDMYVMQIIKQRIDDVNQGENDERAA